MSLTMMVMEERLGGIRRCMIGMRGSLRKDSQEACSTWRTNSPRRPRVGLPLPTLLAFAAGEADVQSASRHSTLS